MSDAAYMREYRKRNAEKIKKLRRAWNETHTEHNSKQTLRYRTDNAGHVKQKQAEWYRLNGDRKRDKERIRRIGFKRRFVEAYGGCSQCGESRLEFVVADHVNDDGAKMRRDGQHHGLIYKWALDHGCPPFIQCLCHNHNSKKEKVRRQARRSVIREAVVNHYGGVCECCGESDTDMLEIDHIDGGGTRHRLREGYKRVEVWLHRHGLPPGYRVLCANCNVSTHYGDGVCLHKRSQP